MKLHLHFHPDYPKDPDYAYVVRRGTEYLAADKYGESEFVELKAAAFQWKEYELARAYAEVVEGAVYKRFSDGYERPVSGNFQHP